MSESTLFPAGEGTGEVGQRRSVALCILWAILTIGIYTFFWTYRTFEEMRRYSGRGLGGTLALVIYLGTLVIGGFGAVIIAVLASGELERLLESDGRRAEHSALWGLWLLLPVAGPFIWFIPTQHALNAFWEDKGAPPP